MGILCCVRLGRNALKLSMFGIISHRGSATGLTVLWFYRSDIAALGIPIVADLC